MTTSRNIAGLLGPTLIAVALSEGLNFPVLLANTTPSVIYLNGTLLFIAGFRLSVITTAGRVARADHRCWLASPARWSGPGKL
jgi:hypothetical protein